MLVFFCAGLVSAEQPALVFKGAWVTAWTEGFYTPEQVDETLSAAKEVGINNIFIQVRKNADAYYDSKLESAGAGMQAGFDPLAYTITQAHKMGIKVHAWINVYRVWTAPTKPVDPKHIVNLHPEWLSVDYSGAARASDGVYLDPGNPQARKYVLSVISDISKRYELDGIHLDYIRYPGNTWGYSKRALLEWRKASKRTDLPKPTDADWSDWRRSQVTSLVRSIFIEVRKIRPKAEVSSSVICWGSANGSFEQTSAYKDTLQNWKKWASAGFVDALAPMNYVDQKKSAVRYSEWLAAFERWKLKRPVYVGVYATVNTPEDILVQAQLAEKTGKAGWVLFSFNKGATRDAILKAFLENAPVLEVKK